MSSERPNPDELLARVQAQGDLRRGRLKVFFGYAAGVGKTFAMLEAVRREKAAGVDVVVGYVEPHGRRETEALLEGLEVLPAKMVSYYGTTLREFDLDAALARRPQLILVDELAHTNAEGCRHAKRWQDVQELLSAGIDVFTTLNVQHVESLNDVIAQITGVVVRETLPDAVLDRADAIELVDLTPEELAERFRAGKVYVPQQAERALQNFFQKPNLVALRELSLRQAADRLGRDVQSARQERAATGPWATSERLLVCAGPSPTTSKLLRTARRMAAAFRAEWLAVSVETPGRPPSPEARERLARHLRQAEQLGAETHTLVGANIADAILEFARARNVTKIVVGKTAQPWWRRLVFGTAVDQLLERSGDIDVYVIRGEADTGRRSVSHATDAPPPNVHRGRYVASAAIVAICGLVGWLSFLWHPTEANVVMVFLLGVAYVAARYGRGPAVAAAAASVLAFDFFFVPPYYQFAVSDWHYVVTFVGMLIIGITIGELTTRLREQLQASQLVERRTAALYRLTKQLSEVAGPEFLIANAGQQLREIFGGEVVLFVRDETGKPILRFGAATGVGQHPVNAVVAEWVANHDQVAGLGTTTLPNATALFVPLIGSQRTIGALGVRPDHLEHLADPEQRRLLETCASLIALSLERDQSVLESQQVQVQVQTEQLRNALLSSVSHDLRTPLAAIAGAASGLRDAAPADSTQRELAQSIVEESQRMTRLIENLLDMTRLESGAAPLNRQWHVLEEVVGSARARLRKELAKHPVRVHIPDDFPLVFLDGLLLEQVLVNLLENAARYTQAGTLIEISAREDGKEVTLRVTDEGPGLPSGTEDRVFEKFYRGAPEAHADGRRGVGLGLAICRGIVEAHGGRIRARNRPGGGAEFLITLPSPQPAPRVELDEALAPAGGTDGP